MNMLVITGLSKSFGDQKIINDLNLSVPEGSIFGFIGKNGAGKTTTMKMILGLLRPGAGKITIFNAPVQYGQSYTNKYIGYLPDVPEFYNYMTANQYLSLCGEILGLPKKKITERNAELLNLVGLEGIEKHIGGFSRGMKQRLGIAQALVTNPKLLICDEPTSALDPVGRKDILDILYKIKGKTTVLFSTHILSDVERICDHVAVLNEGKIAVSGTLSEIKALHGHDKLLLEFATINELKEFKKINSIQPYLEKAQENGNEIILFNQNIENIYRKIIHVLSETNIYPIKMEIMEPSLENLFLEVIQ